MSYCKLMVGSDCYGVGTEAECRGIMNMHKTVRSGHKKETKASTLDFKFVTVQGDYPSQEAFDGKLKPAPLGYKNGTVLGPFK